MMKCRSGIQDKLVVEEVMTLEERSVRQPGGSARCQQSGGEELGVGWLWEGFFKDS